jgi:DNA replication protein DnaC
MLMGSPGTGKSHLMSFFSKNPHTSYSHITCKSVAERYRTGWKRDDLETLEWYSFPLKAEFGHVYGQTQLGYCFGDLGTEDEKKNFGNSMNVMEHIIFQRYENKLPFNLTHITTNLNGTEIENFYGLRIRDRIREMFNIMVLETKESFR